MSPMRRGLNYGFRKMNKVDEENARHTEFLDMWHLPVSVATRLLLFYIKVDA